MLARLRHGDHAPDCRPSSSAVLMQGLAVSPHAVHLLYREYDLKDRGAGRRELMTCRPAADSSRASARLQSLVVVRAERTPVPSRQGEGPGLDTP